MRKIVNGVVLLLLAGSLQAQKQLVVDADAEMRTVSGSYTSIKVSGGIDLYLSQSDEAAIAISASDDKFKPGLKTVVENGQLNIYADGEWALNMRNKKLVVYVSFKELEKIIASGASDIVIAGTIRVPSLQLQLSGASDFKGAVEVGNLDMRLSGASDVKISGNATNLTIESSGASDVKGYDLTAEVCNAKASGASDINITVTKELSAHASGASKILYKGPGVIKDLNSNGASTISKKGR
jgi:hypothetical protein